MYRQSVAAKFNSTASGKIPENSIAEFALRGGSGERGAVARVFRASLGDTQPSRLIPKMYSARQRRSRR